MPTPSNPEPTAPQPPKTPLGNVLNEPHFSPDSPDDNEAEFHVDDVLKEERAKTVPPTKNRHMNGEDEGNVEGP